MPHPGNLLLLGNVSSHMIPKFHCIKTGSPPKGRLVSGFVVFLLWEEAPVPFSYWLKQSKGAFGPLSWLVAGGPSALKGLP